MSAPIHADALTCICIHTYVHAHIYILNPLASHLSAETSDEEEDDDDAGEYASAFVEIDCTSCISLWLWKS